MSGSESGPGTQTANFTGGSATVTVDGVSFTFTPTGGAGLSFVQTGNFKDIKTGGCNETTFTATDVGFSSSLQSANSQTCSTFNSLQFIVGSTGTSQIFVSLSCNGVTTTIDASGTINAFGQPPAATPELGSGELLGTGLVPVLGILLYRRRRQRRAAK